MGARSTFATARGAAKLQAVVAGLELRPMTAAQIGEHVGMSRALAWQYLDFLHGSRPKRAFVAGWFPTGRKLSAIYALGAYPDVDKPMPIRRWRREQSAEAKAAQQRQNDARQAAKEAARQARTQRAEAKQAATAPPKPMPEPPPIAAQTWFSALGR